MDFADEKRLVRYKAVLVEPNLTKVLLAIILRKDLLASAKNPKKKKISWLGVDIKYHIISDIKRACHILGLPSRSISIQTTENYIIYRRHFLFLFLNKKHT